MLEIADENVLKLPKHTNAVDAWQEWLGKYTAVHGMLPTALVDFLAGLCGYA